MTGEGGSSTFTGKNVKGGALWDVYYLDLLL